MPTGANEPEGGGEGLRTLDKSRHMYSDDARLLLRTESSPLPCARLIVEMGMGRRQPVEG